MHLCQQGRKIEAIGRRHAASGSSLLEAKHYVDALEQGLAPSSSSGQLPGGPALLDEQVAAYCRRGAKLEAIKYYRNQTGVGLREAKDYVEAVEARLGAQFVANRSTALPASKSAPAAGRHGLRVLLGSAGLFAALTLATSSHQQAADGADTYGFPEPFYQTGTGYSPSQHRNETYRSFDQPALLLDAGFAVGATLLVYVLGRFLARKLRPKQL